MTRGNKVNFSAWMWLRVALTFVAAVVPEWGQTNLSCFTNNISPALLRAESRAELVSDYVITCQGGVAGSTLTLDVSAQLNANVNSKILALATSASEALLLVNDPTSPSIGVNAFQGQSGGNSIVFQRVAVPMPGSSGTTTIRITNVRVDALSIAGLNNPDPSQILMFVSIQQLLNNPQVTSGFVLPGLTFGLRSPTDTLAASIDLQQPAGQNVPLATSTSASGGAINNVLKFSELFATSFKKRNVATTLTTPTGIADQSAIGTSYNTESGYYNSLLPPTNGLNKAGLASQGTRLIAKFSNVPAGVTLYVTTVPLASISSGTSASLVSSDATGSGIYSATPQTTTATCPGCASPVPIAPVALINGSGIAVWEVLNASPTDLDQFGFGLVVAYGSPKAGSITVDGVYGPVGTGADDLSTAPTPRFGISTNANAAACSNATCLIVPNAVNLTYEKGSSTLPTVSIPIKSSGGPITFFATAISGPQIINPLGAAPPGSWLNVTPNSATTNGSMTVSISPASLATGLYTGYISVVAAGVPNNPQWIYVQLSVVPPPGGISANPMICSNNSGVPPIVRAEGVTEIAGDFYFFCTGGTPTASGVPVPNTTLQLGLNTEVTGRLANTDFSEALLLIDEPTSAQQRPCTQATCSITGAGTSAVDYLSGSTPNIFQARQTSAGSLTWTAPIDPPANGGNRVLHFVNLRANAARLGFSQTQIPNQVIATISIPGISIINSPQQTIGFVFAGKSTSIANWGGPTTSTLTFQQAGGSNAALVSSPSAAGGVASYAISLKEGYASAFKRRNVSFSVFSILNQNVPGAIYATESDFYNSSFPTTNGLNVAGLATQGTRLMAKFDNVPAGVKLFVTVNPTNSPANAQLVTTDSQGAGAYAPTTQTTTALFGAAVQGIAPVTITNGSGSAIWEVLTANELSLETLTFGVVAAYNAPVAGAATVTTLFAPTTAIDVADASAPMPRFDERGNSPSACFVNCSSDPGPITINYKIGDPPPAPIPLSFSTNTVPSFTHFYKDQYWMTLSQAGAILPATINLIVDPTGLGVGTYSGTVSTDTQNSSVPITLNITSSGLPFKASLTSPTPGSTVPIFATFQWDAGSGVTQYQLALGTSGAGSTDVFNQNMGSARIQFLSNLPSDGRTLFVRLGSMISGSWQYNDYTFRSGAKTVNVTLASVPAGATINVTGSGCGVVNSAGGTNLTAPVTLAWLLGSTCSVTATPASGTATAFSQWEDNSTRSTRVIVTPTSPTTYTASMTPVTCLLLENKSSASAGIAAGVGTYTITSNYSSCPLNPVSNALWLTATISPTEFSQASTITYSFTANPGLARTGTITISDQVFTLTQAANVGSATDSGPLATTGINPRLVLKFSHPQGYQQLGVVNALINQYLNGDGACYLAYSQPLQVLYLVNDLGPASGLSAGLTLGGTGTVSNRQCIIDAGGSSAVGSGNVLTLTLNLTFKPAFNGNKVIYTAARTLNDTSSGWQTLGVAQIAESTATNPRSGTMSPVTGTAVTQTISFTYQDAAIASNLQTAWALINTAIDGRQACYVAYYAPGNQLYLYPDNGDGTAATNIVLAGTNIIQNNQCLISATGSSVVSNGNQLTLNLNVTFKNTFSGPKGVWAAVQTLGGVSTSPWRAVGAWQVP